MIQLNAFKNDLLRRQLTLKSYGLFSEICLRNGCEFHAQLMIIIIIWMASIEAINYAEISLPIERINAAFGVLYGITFSTFAQSIATWFEREIQKTRVKEVNVSFKKRLLRLFLILYTQPTSMAITKLCRRSIKTLKIINGKSFLNGDTAYGVRSTERSLKPTGQGLS